MEWAARQDATLDTGLEPTVTDALWERSNKSLIGDVRWFGRSCEWVGTREFWAPIGMIDLITWKKLNVVPTRISRTAVLHWLRTIRLARHGHFMDAMCFQVLRVFLDGKELFFWRANETVDYFQVTNTQEWQEQREQRQEYRAWRREPERKRFHPGG